MAEPPTSYPVLGFERLDDEPAVEAKAARVLRHQYASSVDARVGERWSPHRCCALRTRGRRPRYHRTDEVPGWA
ncbi:hypothetical protein [Actinokineospora bangkokensis]|uniref:Uncharacterized protein n=1 Tax=Actinokineospora bangkokensis TaxID=1193682 RepID=A0A1Q9LJA8_9PSEU|nr:hypothetical protein [Actinokineospora bangkokensis]OLR92085.1 hypothetical protein BJP25_22290 [Actinokineospora bangkokensis]